MFGSAVVCLQFHLFHMFYFDGFVQDCSKSSALAMELLFLRHDVIIFLVAVIGVSIFSNDDY